MVITNKDTFQQKAETFPQESQFTKYIMIQQMFIKKIQVIQKCGTLIDKHTKKYLKQIRLLHSTLKAQIKIHKGNEPIRPVVDNFPCANIQNCPISQHEKVAEIFDSQRRVAEEILNYTNNIYKHLRFKIAYEENGKINFLDVQITRNEDKITTDIFRKRTTTDILLTTILITIQSTN
jgi:hypothetical protein